MYGFARYNKVNLEHGGKTDADLCKTGVAGPGGVAAADGLRRFHHRRNAGPARHDGARQHRPGDAGIRLQRRNAGTGPGGRLAGKLGLAYASSDPAVVMVDADGNLAAVGAGGSADTASDPNASASVSLEYGALPFSLAAQTHTWWYIDSTDSAYRAVLNNMNAYRAAAGVAPLSVDANLSAIADQRTADMIVAGYISHEGYQTSEIVAQNYPSAQDVVYGWATSPDHYAAMTNPNFTICGIGCSFEESGGAYWCVTFQ